MHTHTNTPQCEFIDRKIYTNFSFCVELFFFYCLKSIIRTILGVIWKFFKWILLCIIKEQLPRVFITIFADDKYYFEKVLTTKFIIHVTRSPNAHQEISLNFYSQTLLFCHLPYYEWISSQCCRVFRLLFIHLFDAVSRLKSDNYH